MHVSLSAPWGTLDAIFASLIPSCLQQRFEWGEALTYFRLRSVSSSYRIAGDNYLSVSVEVCIPCRAIHKAGQYGWKRRLCACIDSEGRNEVRDAGGHPCCLWDLDGAVRSHHCGWTWLDAHHVCVVAGSSKSSYPPYSALLHLPHVSWNSGRSYNALSQIR